MDLFKRPPIRPSFPVVPAEPPMRGIGERRRQLLELIDEELKVARAAGDWEVVDEFLGARMAVMRLAQAAAPVIPGRTP